MDIFDVIIGVIKHNELVRCAVDESYSPREYDSGIKEAKHVKQPFASHATEHDL